MPTDLEYQGAFRLPYVEDHDAGGYTIGWHWGGTGAAYYPDHNSLFIVGHDHTMYVGEVSIPAPVISDNIESLNTAETLQGLTNIRSGITNLTTLFNNANIRRAGLAYLPAQGDQTQEKLYSCWGAHFQSGGQNLPSHAWCNTDFTGRAGAWRLFDEETITLYQTNDYLFEVPVSFANTYLSGRRLISGRYRDGGWSGEGPNLIAFAPWDYGNPPTNEAIFDTALRLVGYSSSDPAGYNFGGGHTLNDYNHADEWSGGAWLTTGGKAAVTLVGTKGMGNYWYGFSDGSVFNEDGSVLYPDGTLVPPPGPGEPEDANFPLAPHNDRGWWAPTLESEVIFYDPADLASVASGIMQPYEVQPYATLVLDDYLYNQSKVPELEVEKNRYLLGACAYDSDHQRLYIIEYRGEPTGVGLIDDNPIVHVFRVN